MLAKEEIDAWRDIPVAVAVDLAPHEQLDIRIRPLNPPRNQPKLFGTAVTVDSMPPDFGAVLHALELLEPGNVLVIATNGDTGTAMTGEILGGHMRSKGCAGLVCDGAVRDVETLAGFPDFSVFARAINPHGPTGASLGSVQVPIEIDGRTVNPGDLIIGDDDGLIALSPASVRNCISDANAKLKLETEWVKALANGSSVVETFDLEEAMQIKSS